MLNKFNRVESKFTHVLRIFNFPDGRQRCEAFLVKGNGQSSLGQQKGSGSEKRRQGSRSSTARPFVQTAKQKKDPGRQNTVICEVVRG